tara:strand:- start:1513 stop:2172 length:660 start_codon:yes stop_codon:yes gene_type:complete
MSKMKLYGMPLSSRVNRVRFLLNFLNKNIEFIYINLFEGETRSESYSKISDNLKVPCLEDGGYYLSESNSILRYLATKYESPLYPKELQEKCKVDQWLDFIAIHIDEPMNRLMFNKFIAPNVGVHPSERSIKEATFMLNFHLPVIEQQLSKYRFIASDEMSIADLCLLAVVDTFELLELKMDDYPCLNAWKERLIEESFYTRCHSSYLEAFRAYMKQSL